MSNGLPFHTTSFSHQDPFLLAVCICLDVASVGSSPSIFSLRYYQCDDSHHFTNPSTTGSQELKSYCHCIHFLGLLIFAKLSITKGYLPEHCLWLKTSRTVSLSPLHSQLPAIPITPYSLLRDQRRFFLFAFFSVTVYISCYLQVVMAAS